MNGHQVRSKRDNSKIFKSKKPKGSKQDIPNRLMSHMPEGNNLIFLTFISRFRWEQNVSHKKNPTEID